MGGGGGGSASSIPEYLEQAHWNWLNNGSREILYSHLNMTALMNEALQEQNNPYNGMSFYSASTALAVAEAEVNKLKLAAAALDPTTDWLFAFNQASQSINSLIDDTTANNQIKSFRDLLDDDFQAKVLPEFEAGMRDINAVMSSAFIVGKALIIDERDKKLVQYGAELKHKYHLWRNEATLQSTAVVADLVFKRLSFMEISTKTTMDMQRIRIIAMREGVDQDIRVREAKSTWKFEVFIRGSQVLASVQGGVGGVGPKGMSQGQSALAGAATGAASGAMVGSVVPGIGTAIGAIGGAIIGGIGGYLSAG